MNQNARLSVTWIALCAVLLHALLPFAHAAQGPAGVVTSLCSPTGNTRLVFIPSGEGDVGDPPWQALKCPLCLAGAHDALTAPAAVSFGAPAGLNHLLAAALGLDARVCRAASQVLARGPPLR